MLFTDGSVNTKSKVGYGAYVMVESMDTLSPLVKVKQFENTSSTKLELQTLLWALGELQNRECHIIIHTDSQNIISLPKRRERFEKNGFLTSKQVLISNYLLYQSFYAMMDRLDCSLVKVEGHKRLDDKDAIDDFFTLVDRASRNALRESGA